MPRAGDLPPKYEDLDDLPPQYDESTMRNDLEVNMEPSDIIAANTEDNNAINHDNADKSAKWKEIPVSVIRIKCD